MERLTILLIGRGGRESALVYKLSQSEHVQKIYVAPGNGGTAQGLEKVENITDITEEDFEGLVELSKKLNLNLVVPGLEVPIVKGIEGHFRSAGICCFSPSQAAAQLEGSKAFSKDFMARHDIPTAKYRNFTNYSAAKAYLDSVDHKVVLKASGLAAGKGAIIPDTKEQALVALKQIMLEGQFGVIEEFLEGEELSILTFSDGTTFKSMPPAQDHKRIFDGDLRPNIGGMGCYAPANIASYTLLDVIEKSILKPTFDDLRKEGNSFVGMLFTGIMLTKSGPKTLEYDARFGDLEAQTLLPLLKTDLARLMVACVDNGLQDIDIGMEDMSCTVVIISAAGYPGLYIQGDEIEMEHRHVDGDMKFFHAGTPLDDNESLVTAGGRVLAISATATTLEQAVDKAYEGVSTVTFDGMHYRKDIAHRAFRSS